MTPEKIDKLRAHLGTDALIASQVMGAEVHATHYVYKSGGAQTKTKHTDFKPSSLIAHAMKAVDHFITEHWGTEILIVGCRHSPEDAALWHVEISNSNGLGAHSEGYDKELVICRALLKAAEEIK